MAEDCLEHFSKYGTEMCIPHLLLGVLCSMEEITQAPIHIFKGEC